MGAGVFVNTWWCPQRPVFQRVWQAGRSVRFQGRSARQPGPGSGPGGLQDPNPGPLGVAESALARPQFLVGLNRSPCGPFTFSRRIENSPVILSVLIPGL